MVIFDFHPTLIYLIKTTTNKIIKQEKVYKEIN